MEKLRKYNQKLQAIIGTIIVLFLIGLLIAGIVALIIDNIPHNPIENGDSITINGQEGNKTKFRDQIISFEDPYLIDTLNKIYLIPITQVNLKVPEVIAQDVQYLRGPDYALEAKDYYYNRNYGSYNNFVLFDQTKNEKKKLFSKVTYISSYQMKTIDSSVFVFFEGTTEDSNGNQKLDQEDLKSLYIYAVNTGLMRNITYSNMSFEEYYPLLASSQLLLKFKIDKDKNGYSEFREPSRYKVLDLSTGTTTDFLDENLLQELQSLID